MTTHKVLLIWEDPGVHRLRLYQFENLEDELFEDMKLINNKFLKDTRLTELEMKAWQRVRKHLRGPKMANLVATDTDPGAGIAVLEAAQGGYHIIMSGERQPPRWR